MLSNLTSFFIILETCVALNFINSFGPPFKLYSSLKHEAYLVTGSGFKLKLMIDRPELHSYVIFNAEDSEGKGKMFLNGKSKISEPVVHGCPVFRDVIVTSEQGKRSHLLLKEKISFIQSKGIR